MLHYSQSLLPPARPLPWWGLQKRWAPSLECICQEVCLCSSELASTGKCWWTAPSSETVATGTGSWGERQGSHLPSGTSHWVEVGKVLRCRRLCWSFQDVKEFLEKKKSLHLMRAFKTIFRDFFKKSISPVVAVGWWGSSQRCYRSKTSTTSTLALGEMGRIWRVLNRGATGCDSF